MRKEGIMAGGVIAVIGIVLMVFPVFKGITLPFLGSIGSTTTPYAQLGFYILIGGVIIIVVSAFIPSRISLSPASSMQRATTIQAIKCPKCGNLNDKEAVFCKFCGERLVV